MASQFSCAVKADWMERGSQRVKGAVLGGRDRCDRAPPRALVSGDGRQEHVSVARAARKPELQGSGGGCVCDVRHPLRLGIDLHTVILMQTALLTTFTTTSPVTIHASLVTVRALV